MKRILLLTFAAATVVLLGGCAGVADYGPSNHDQSQSNHYEQQQPTYEQQQPSMDGGGY